VTLSTQEIAVLPIPRSGFCLPNKVARAYLEALEEVAGQTGVSAVLNVAGLSRWTESFPPDDLYREVDFATFASLSVALEQLYGPRGGRGQARRSGWAAFQGLLRSGGPLTGLGEILLGMLPMRTRLRLGMGGLSRLLSLMSDDTCSYEELDGGALFTIHRCPICWGRATSEPACHALLGLLEGGLRWLEDSASFQVTEVACIGCGDEFCQFHVETGKRD
jgi:hypothetical protein